MKKARIITLMLILSTALMITLTVMAADPIVDHFSEKQYNSNRTQWRAHSRTAITQDGKQVYHYTRCRIVNTIIPAIIYEDSGRVYGWGTVHAYTNYVAANEQGYSLRSYWGTEIE